jgi:hypothetical protein
MHVAVLTEVFCKRQLACESCVPVPTKLDEQ